MLWHGLSGHGQTTQAGGHISGHVYRADSHAPLAGVTMTLQVHGNVVASAQTATDGTYSFDNLPADDYVFAVWKNGFVGRLYGVDSPDDYTVRRLMVLPDSRLDGIDFSLQPEPNVAQMADAALTETHPDLRKHLSFTDGRFSPDGSEFAFGVTNIRSGDLDEIWLYDLSNKRLRRVFERPVPFVWGKDGKLYVRVMPDPDKYLVATRDSISETDLPSDVADAMARWTPGGDDVKRVGKYSVSAENQGHGFFELLVRSQGIRGTHAITKGSWELQTFLLNSARKQVLYPAGFWFGSIVTYDLRTGQSAALDFQSKGGVRLLDLAGDGKVVAYFGSGPCGQDESSYEWLLHIESRMESRAAHVCFVRLK